MNSVNASTASNNDKKLRRSRRLSSTRGLKRETFKSQENANVPLSDVVDLNQKLGLCPMISKNSDNTDENKKTLINWELNERISLSSGSSAGIQIRPDIKRGIEFSDENSVQNCRRVNKSARSETKKCHLDLMNVSGFPKSPDKKYNASESTSHRNSKNYLDSEDLNVIKSDSKYEIGIPENSLVKKKRHKTSASRLKADKWDAKQKNDSITKRLELIHELNQKILANYERFQQKSKRSYSKGSSKNVKAVDQYGKEDIYTKVVPNCKNKKLHKEKKGEKRETEKLDINKFTFSKDYCQKIILNKMEDKVTKEKKNVLQYPENVNKNFSLAVKPEFFTPQKTMNSLNIKIDEMNRSITSRNEIFQKKTTVEISHNQESIDTRSTKRVELAVEDSKDQNSGKNQKKLEEEVLEDLNETIGKFDEIHESLIDCSGAKNVSTDEKSESFSTDSIQSVSLRNDKSNKDTSLLDTFNSSWDSGVGVDVNTGSGWVRIHTGIESSLVYLTLDTTAKDVCRDMLLGDDLSLFIQYGGEPGRRLLPSEKPLEIQDSFLQRLGYDEASRRARLGVDPELRHLIAFHVGPSPPLPELTGYSRCGFALVLKGLVFPQWKKRPLAVIGSKLFLYPATLDGHPEWIELGGEGGAVCYAPSRLGKLVLRVTGFPRITGPENMDREETHSETRHLYLGFHHPWDRDLWRSWLKQATQSPVCLKRLDLSSGGLSRIPDSTIAFPTIEEFLLGHNELANSENNFKILQRFPRLHIVHLECNNLKAIPSEILELRRLTYLDLSDNNIKDVPSEINNLVNLKELILDNNGIKDLPAELVELKQLKNISLAGNLLTELPLFLKMRALALSDVLSKGDHTKAYKEERNNHNNLHKVNLRNNQLKGNIILGNYGNLTHLDVSENSIEKLDVSALQELKSVRCARNLLTELTLCGKNLVSLIAGNNNLRKLIIDPIPRNLEHLDVSYNSLDSLPEWTPDLPMLRALFASHNILTALPDRLLSQPSRLEVLHLPHNRLQALPPPRRPLNIVHLTLQGNALITIPASFFANTEKMKVLNLSNNRLSELPYVTDDKKRENSHTLEKLYLTGNCLSDTALDALAKLPALRVLHIAYNALDTLPESCIASWSELEELILSGNRLQYLPDNVANLQHLRVLRVHSNRLLTCPTFNKTSSLKVLDLAHNQLDRVNLSTLVPPKLQFLDISCNTHLHVDPRQFQVYRSQRPVSLVDVSGQNRPSLPSHPHQQEIVSSEKHSEHPWRLGFSETSGGREKLYVSQVRMPSFCNIEGLFGIFDGGTNQEAPAALQEIIPRLLLEERTVRETSKDYLKYTLLAAHRELKEKGQKYGIDATLVHMTRLAVPQGYPKASRRYSLKIASSGEAKAVLCRAAGPLTLAPSKKTAVQNQLGKASMFPLVVSDPVTEEVTLEDDDEFIIIANRKVWEVLSVQEAVREARAEASPVLAAKRLQDLAQAYGAEDNLSIIVVRLTGPGNGDMDLLMRELRHAVGKNRNKTEESKCSCPCCVTQAPHKSPAACCCHTNEGYYLNGVLKNIINRSNKPHGGSGKYFKNTRASGKASPSYRDDRSSPSGQSDQASDSTFKSRHPSSNCVWPGMATSRTATKSRQSVLMQENGTRRVTSCLQPQEDTISDKSNGPLSEEQFRCWEYMLEQNTQLLFDKELDTLTRSPLKRGQSRSTPQLAGNLPFLSKRFGSARSFNPVISRSPAVRFGSGRRLLNGGPNAAYFGSLQRLMPYNLEYDFAVIQERNGMDSLEQDFNRMQQYWGVATTEL